MGTLYGNKNAAGPHKKLGALKDGIKSTIGSVRDGAVIGGVLGGTAGRAISNNVAKSLGMQTAKATLGQHVARGAVMGARASVPLSLAIGSATVAAKLYSDRQKEKKSIRGRLATAKETIVSAKDKLKAKVK